MQVASGLGGAALWRACRIYASQVVEADIEDATGWQPPPPFDNNNWEDEGGELSDTVAGPPWELPLGPEAPLEAVDGVRLPAEPTCPAMVPSVSRLPPVVCEMPLGPEAALEAHEGGCVPVQKYNQSLRLYDTQSLQGHHC